MNNGLSRNIGAVGGALGGLTIGSGIVFLAARHKAKKKTKTTRASNRRKHSNRQSKPKRYKRRYSYSKKNKRVSHKRIRYTKNNQPYIILSSGKAKFIKRTSASKSRKRKGGKY